MYVPSSKLLLMGVALLCAFAVAQPTGAAWFELLETGSVAEIRSALRAGAPIDARDETGRTPLMYAVLNPSPEVASLLLDHGVNVNARNEAGFTPLMVAAGGASTRRHVELLIAAGAEVNALDAQSDRTALMHAATSNRRGEVLKALLAAGGDVHVRDRYGLTALNNAAHGTSRIIKYRLYPKPPSLEGLHALIAGGSAIESRDTNGRTPLMNAARRNEYAYVTRTLLEAGAPLEARDDDGRTAVMLAARHNDNPEVLVALVASGADLNAQDAAGMTPLMLATKRAEDSVALWLLLEYGAELDTQDRLGMTALMHAAERRTGRAEWNHTQPVFVQLLLDAGADAALRDSDGNSAADYARENAAFFNELEVHDAYWLLNEGQYQ